MTFSGSLTSAKTHLILDTSVLINLNASQHGESIVAAIPYDILVPRIVLEELTRPTEKSGGGEGFANTLFSKGLAQAVPLSDNESIIYERLTAGEISLGDGEAASIAMAAVRGFCVAIDDGKARDHATSLFETIDLCWSIDLMLHPEVVSVIACEIICEALFLALRDGRMRIHESHCETVVNIIGRDHARQCPSLPGFKKRRKEWGTGKKIE